jgi:hypothetical protein
MTSTLKNLTVNKFIAYLGQKFCWAKDWRCVRDDVEGVKVYSYRDIKEALEALKKEDKVGFNILCAHMMTGKSAPKVSSMLNTKYSTFLEHRTKAVEFIFDKLMSTT